MMTLGYDIWRGSSARVGGVFALIEKLRKSKIFRLRPTNGLQIY